MKRILFLSMLCVGLCFSFISCGGDDDDNGGGVTPTLKTITVEIQRTSDFLPALEDNNSFSVNPKTIYDEKDWDITYPNEVVTVLVKVNKELTSNKYVYTFKQEKVKFQLESALFNKSDDVDSDDITCITKVTIKVDGKVVKEESYPFQNILPIQIGYEE